MSDDKPVKIETDWSKVAKDPDKLLPALME